MLLGKNKTSSVKGPPTYIKISCRSLGILFSVCCASTSFKFCLVAVLNESDLQSLMHNVSWY